MNADLILPELVIKDNKSYISVVTRALISDFPKHEYGLVLTILRLILKVITDYERSRIAMINFYNPDNGINATSLLHFSNNVESLITDLLRISKTFGNLLKYYPEYINVLPKEAANTIERIKKETGSFRNDFEHIYDNIMGEPSKSPRKMGAIIPKIENGSILIERKRLEIEKLILWIETLDSYSYFLEESFPVSYKGKQNF